MSYTLTAPVKRALAGILLASVFLITSSIVSEPLLDDSVDQAESGHRETISHVSKTEHLYVPSKGESFLDRVSVEETTTTTKE